MFFLKLIHQESVKGGVKSGRGGGEKEGWAESFDSKVIVLNGSRIFSSFEYPN